jgi:hypothetical protein
MAREFSTRPSALLGCEVSWLAYQIDSAAMTLGDEWEAERNRAEGDGKGDVDGRVRRAFERFIAGDHAGGSDWQARAREASRKARAEWEARRAARPGEVWEVA